MRQALDSVDLVQSVHRALLPGLRDGRYAFSDEGQLLALAVTVLRHKFQRAAQKKRPAALDPHAEPIDRTLPPPSSRAESDDLLAHVLGEVDGLDRRAMELLAQGYSTVEIATALECTPAVLRARLSRARSRLRDSGLNDQV
jgi:RNA polymerase sigma-70 factor (ECF subfamily)